MPLEREKMVGVRSITLPLEGNLFEELFASVRFEDVGRGRRGAVLVQVDERGRAPLVRTTTRYSHPAQPFQPVHEQLARQIKDAASISPDFNNALIESYTNAYTSMGSHSDQALDLADESFIAIFSCYRHPELARPPRKLLIEPKEPFGQGAEIALTHHSVVVFSVQTNRRLRHKIVLQVSPRAPENDWLGLTFRTSRTFVELRDGEAYLPDDTPLTLANEEQRREFYSLRSRENKEAAFTYPRITYTISESDRMPPECPDGLRLAMNAVGSAGAQKRFE